MLAVCSHSAQVIHTLKVNLSFHYSRLIEEISDAFDSIFLPCDISSCGCIVTLLLNVNIHLTTVFMEHDLSIVAYSVLDSMSVVNLLLLHFLACNHAHSIGVLELSSYHFLSMYM